MIRQIWNSWPPQLRACARLLIGCCLLTSTFLVFNIVLPPGMIVEVRSEIPDAEVWVDGRFLGKTPLQLDLSGHVIRGRGFWWRFPDKWDLDVLRQDTCSWEFGGWETGPVHLRVLSGKRLLNEIYRGSCSFPLGWVWRRCYEASITFQIPRCRLTRLEDEGLVLSEEKAYLLDLDPNQAGRVQEILRQAHREYRTLEAEKTQSRLDENGHLHIRVSRMSQEGKAVRARLESALGEVMKPWDIDYLLRCVEEPGLFCYFGRSGLAVELWKDAEGCHWIWHRGPRGDTSSDEFGSAPDFPVEYHHLWRDIPK